MKKFLTLFPLTSNIHLTKDVGMIPYILFKDFGYESTLACYDNGNYEYLENEVKGLKIVFIKRIFNNVFIDSLLFLLFNGRKYDILQLYHLNRWNAALAYFFKVFTVKRRFTYLKLDTEEYVLDFKFSGLTRGLYKFLIKNINVISVETKILYQKLNDGNILGREVIYIPNGFYDHEDFEKSTKKDAVWDTKIKKILTVGRIGTAQKSNETLLEAFSLFSKYNQDWTLELIGSVESNFQKYIDDYFQRNVELKSRVHFTGFISDRELLAKKYAEAQIFVLTSRFESFGLVYLEAMQAGCYVISTDILPAYDITDNGKYGDLFKVGDTEGLSKLLLQAVDNPDKLEDNRNKVQDYVYQNFNWPIILKSLDKSLQNGG